MHHVDQERPAAGLPPPRAVLEILVRLAEHFGADDSDQPPEPAAFHDLDRLGHDRIVLSMMPRQQFHPGALGRLTQPFAVLDGVRQRLLDEGRNTGSDTGKPLLDMQPIGRRKNDAVGTLLEQVRQMRR